jgi:hypothetical protein
VLTFAILFVDPRIAPSERVDPPSFDVDEALIRGRDLFDPSSQLDELRGLAVLIVFLSHTSNPGVYLFPHVDASGIGKSGVYLCFVLSAFLLASPFLQAADSGTALRLEPSDFGRRFWRIYPLSGGSVLLALIVTLAWPGSRSSSSDCRSPSRPEASSISCCCGG